MVGVGVLPGQLGIGNPLSSKLAHSDDEPISVIQRIVSRAPIIEPENLFSNVVVKVERFHGHIRPPAAMRFVSGPDL
jgi:hypothetical protein